MARGFCTFSDIISEISADATEAPVSVAKELERGAIVYDERQKRKSTVKTELKPLYDKERKKAKRFNKIITHKCYCRIVKPAKRATEVCKHTGHVTIDRNVLTRDEHIEFLAMPKQICDPPPKYLQPYFYCVKKILPNCTPRIDALAAPSKKNIVGVLQQFGKILPPRSVDHLTSLLADKGKTYVNIQKAIDLHRENKAQQAKSKARARKDIIKLKRKITKMKVEQVKKLICSISEIMRPFLMTDQKVDLCPEMQVISDMLQCRIKCFMGDTGLSEFPELVDKFVKTLADNITLWIRQFLSNFGFESVFQLGKKMSEKRCAPCEENDLKRQIPIDDYIAAWEAQSPHEEYLDLEEYENEYDDTDVQEPRQLDGQGTGPEEDA